MLSMASTIVPRRRWEFSSKLDAAVHLRSFYPEGYIKDFKKQFNFISRNLLRLTISTTLYIKHGTKKFSFSFWIDK